MESSQPDFLKAPQRPMLALLPFHQSKPGSLHGLAENLSTICRCNTQYPLKATRCPTCKTKNLLQKLLKKQRRLNEFLTHKLQQQLPKLLLEAEVFVPLISQYESLLSDFLQHTFPKRQKGEDLNLFLRRVLTFFESLFQATSPARMARSLGDHLERSTTLLAQQAWKTLELGLGNLIETTLPPPHSAFLSEQHNRIRVDLLTLVKPYLDALRTIKLYHIRWLAAYESAKPILTRKQEEKGARAIWNKVRAVVNSPGKRMDFKTAIWRSSEEKATLERLEGQLGKFLEQAQRFLQTHKNLMEENESLLRKYKDSLHQAILTLLLQRLAELPFHERLPAIRHILSKKGVGYFWQRWCFKK